VASALAIVAGIVAVPAAGASPSGEFPFGRHHHQPPPPEPPSLQLVIGGLNNPRGLTPGPFGSLLLAEAGSGGTSCFPFTDPDSGEPTTECGGQTGQVSLVFGNHQRVLTTNLSAAGQDGSEAVGPTDAIFTDEGKVIYTENGAPVTGVPVDSSALGKLDRIDRQGDSKVIADLAAYEASANPDGKQIDSDPYAVASDGRHTYVADAAGNDVLEVHRDGSVSTVAVLPPIVVTAPPAAGPPPGTQIPAEAVPDSLTIGPDGALYVGELTGFPFAPGAAQVVRIGRNGVAKVVAGGFTNIIDLQFDPSGHLYVLEIAQNGLLDPTSPGALIRVERDGTQATVISDGLVAPGGLAIDGRGRIFVTNHSTEAGTGEIDQVVS